MKSKYFVALFVTCTAVSGCALNDGHDFGDSCVGWVEVYNHQGPECKAESCSAEYKVARDYGFCPVGYLCSINNEKSGFAMNLVKLMRFCATTFAC